MSGIDLFKQRELEELIKGKWIVWRWRGDKAWSKDFVYNVEGDILELTKSNTWSKYPLRVLSTEIDYRLSNP